MLLGTWVVKTLGSALAGREVIRAGEGTITVGGSFNTALSFN